MMKCDEKLGIFFERELKDESMKSKITQFGSRFAKKSKSQLEKKFEHEQREIEIEN